MNFNRNFLPGNDSLLSKSLENFNNSYSKEIEVLQDFMCSNPSIRSFKIAQKNVEEAEKYRVDLLKVIPTFSGLTDDQIRAAADSMEEKTFLKNDNIIVQDDIGDSFYILTEGRVSILKKIAHDDKGFTKELGVLEKNSHFGELALLTEERRAATIKVISDKAVCLVMTKEIFDYIIATTDKILENNQRKIVSTVVRKNVLLKNFPPHQIERILDSMVLAHFQPNSYIGRQGSLGHTFHIVVEGVCKAMQAHPETQIEKEVKRFFPGDHFEIQALFSNSYYRPYSYVTVNHVSCFTLSKNDFNLIYKNSILEKGLINSLHKTNSSLEDSSISEVAQHAHITGTFKRISCFDENNIKSEEKSRKYLKRIFTFMVESLTFSLYWRLYREIVINSSKVIEYGDHAREIITNNHDKLHAVEAIIHITKVILSKKTSQRTVSDTEFLNGILMQKNELINNFCKNWTPHQFIMLAKKMRIALFLPLTKVCEADHPANCAYLLLKGTARVFSPYVEKVSKARKFRYENDLFPGSLVGEPSLGGVNKRLQNVLAITPCEFLVIDSADYMAIDERNGIKQLSVNDKLEFLMKIPIFESYEKYDLFRISRALVLETIPKHSLTLEKGQSKDSFYFIFNGRLDILSDIDDKFALASLQKYDYFGESSILRNYFLKTRKEMNHNFKGKEKTLGNYHYLECFDARSGTSVEVLVLKKEFFHLIDRVTLKHIKTAYVSRMKWRAGRADILYQEFRDQNRARVKFFRESESDTIEESHSIKSSSFIPLISSPENVNSTVLKDNPARPVTASLASLPKLNDKINPITLLATSKNSIELSKNRNLLDKLSKEDLIKRESISALSNGFTTLMGASQRTPICEMAMTLCDKDKNDDLHESSTADFIYESSIKNTTKNHGSFRESGIKSADSISKKRQNLIGSVKIPTITSYCEILGKKELIL